MMSIHSTVINRIGVWVLAVVLLAAAPPAVFGAAAQPFADTAGSYAAGEIAALAEAGILNGYADGRFEPAQTVTRAELAKIMALAMGLQENPIGAAAFRDVKPNSWYVGYVGAIASAGVARGVSEMLFAPARPVTREELAVLFVRAFGLEAEARRLAAPADFSDADKVSDWARPHVALAQRIGYLKGEAAAGGAAAFHPQQAADRQALARLAYEFVYNGPMYLEAAAAMAAKGSAPPAPEETETAEDEDVQSPADPDAEAPGVSGGSGNSGGGSGGAGGGGGSAATVQQRLASGTAQGTVTITASGVYGAAEGPDTPVERLIVDPGPDGEVTLRHILPQELEVRSGDVNSIKLMQTVIKSLRVNAVNNNGRDVRIEVKDNTAIESTSIESQAVLESSSGTGSLGKISLAAAAAGKTLTLKGNIDSEITVNAPGSTIKLDPPSGGNSLPTLIKSLRIGANATIQTSGSTQLSTVSVTAPNTTVQLAGGGGVSRVTVDASAGGSTLEVGADTNVQAVQADSALHLTGSADAIAKLTIQGDAAVQLAPDLEAAVQAKAVANAVAAIDALGAADAYSPALAEKLEQAEAAVAAALAYKAPASAITNSDRLEEVKAAVAGWRSKVAEAKEALAIVYQKGDSAAAVTRDFILPRASDLVDSIVWSVDRPGVIDLANDSLRIPAAEEGDIDITLTATISLRGYTETKSFAITIKAESAAGPDQAPIPVQNLVLALTVGDPACELPFASLATDPEGGPLDIEELSYDMEKVTIDIEADSLKVSPLMAGSSEVLVHLSDAMGNRVEVVFTVNTAPYQGKLEAIAAVRAIEALGDAAHYSEELAERIALAEQAVDKAIASGADAGDITNLAKLDAVKAAVLHWQTSVAAERGLLAVGFKEGDSAQAVTGDVVLRTASELVDTIEWASDKPEVIDPLSGKVIRPSAGQSDAVVTLTATIAMHGYADSVSFPVTVKANLPAMNQKPVFKSIPAIELTVGEAPLAIGIDELASDPDGDPLVFLSASAVGQGVQVIKEDKRLLLTGLNAGTYSLLVSITDDRTGFDFAIITVAVNPAPPLEI